MNWVTDLDLQMLNWIQDRFRGDFLDFLMPKISWLGNFGMVWIALALLLLIPKNTRTTALTMGGGLLTGAIVGNAILKNVIARPRPCWLDDSVEILIHVPQDYSCPSGHTLSGFVAATVLFRWDWRAGLLAYCLALFVAFSRLYLYVHYPTDVLFGALLGILIGNIAWFVKMKIENRRTWNELSKKKRKNG